MATLFPKAYLTCKLNSLNDLFTRNALAKHGSALSCTETCRSAMSEIFFCNIIELDGIIHGVCNLTRSAADKPAVVNKKMRLFYPKKERRRLVIGPGLKALKKN